jgi:rod shape determining protein RodA
MMMKRQEDISFSLDWVTVFLYLALILLGWLNIFAAVYDVEKHQSIFDLTLNSGKQLLWIGTSLLLGFIILVIDYKFYDTFAYVIYGLFLIALLAVLVLARDVSGARAWLDFGFMKLQPSEFTKFATSLAVAKFLSNPTARMDHFKTQVSVFAIIGIPALLILLQNDTGSTLVYTSFIIVLYREGLSPIIPILGISAAAILVLTLLIPKFWLVAIFAAVALLIFFFYGRKTLRRGIQIGVVLVIISTFIFGVDIFMNKVLLPHQRDRIYAMLDPSIDPMGINWNITQSKIAIGSGGFLGKGFLQGTQTKFDFVPEQSTDFIFCTIGEEHGFIGSIVLIGLFLGLFARIVFIAERQKSKFARVYGYSVVSIMFFHFMINIGMTIGLFPVIGIPLPFFSYGGSSLWSFTILLFILLKFDAQRKQMLFRG